MLALQFLHTPLPQSFLLNVSADKFIIPAFFNSRAYSARRLFAGFSINVFPYFGYSFAIALGMRDSLL